MKKGLIIALCALGAISPAFVMAQSFTMQADPVDTVWGHIITTGTVSDSVNNVGIDTIYWHVLRTNFPADWLGTANLGICDGDICRQNASNQLWNPGTSSGTTFSCPYPGPGNSHVFDIQLDLTTATTVGSFYLTALLSDHNFNSHPATFVVNNYPTAVVNVNKGIDGLHIYPNPSTDQAHLAFNLDIAGQVQVFVYDVVGRIIFQTGTQHMNAGAQQTSFSTSTFAPGVYNVVVATEGGKATQRLSVVK